MDNALADELPQPRIRWKSLGAALGFGCAWLVAVALPLTTRLTCSVEGLGVIATVAGLLQGITFLAGPIPLPIVLAALLMGHLERTRGASTDETGKMALLAGGIYVAHAPLLGMLWLFILVTRWPCPVWFALGQ